MKYLTHTFRSRISVFDPQATDDIGKCYVSFMIPKLPVSDFG